jgi:hypothetical protein
VYEAVLRKQEQGRPVRVLVLKGRQQGMSTFSQCYLFWRSVMFPGTRAMTVGHVLPAVHDLYRKFERSWKELGTHKLSMAGFPLQPPTEPGGERGRRMIFADPIRSSYRADSATEPEGIGRGGTFNVAHLTEIPQWAKPDETMQAVLAAIPDTPDSAVFIETTAKGAHGWFYEQWVDSMRQIASGIDPEFVPVFVPWFKTERYARSIREGEPPLDKSERDFRDKYQISDEQVLWYRDQKQRFGERVYEEFPSTWQEAFLSSGTPFFRQDATDYYREKRRAPLTKGQFALDRVGSRTTAKFSRYDLGPTHIFAEPDKVSSYSVGIDFASGRSKDRSAIVVVNLDNKQVVATHSSKLLPDDVLTEAVLLAKMYNNALIIPERSGIGQALVDKLVNELKYVNTYRETDPVAVKHHKGTRYGWATSNRTRQWLLEELAHHIHTRALDIPDARIIEELTTFVYTGRADDHAAAAGGCFDDMVMCLAIACRGFSQMSIPSYGKKNRYKVSSVTGY